jgi:hypothetical protein
VEPVFIVLLVCLNLFQKVRISVTYINESVLFQSGELSLKDFHFVVAHPDILPELVSVRGLLKRKFPSQKSGTLKQEKDWKITVSITSLYRQINVYHFLKKTVQKMHVICIKYLCY